MVKAILVLYGELLKDKDFLTKLENNVKLLKKYIGPDSLYAVITSEMKELIDRFPDLVFIRNDEGTVKYGIYKALRKLRGNDVLVIDGGECLSLEKMKEFISARRKNLLAVKEGIWKGLALLRLIDLDYYIRTLEELLRSEVDFAGIVHRVKEKYGIEYDTVQEVGHG